MNVAKLKTGNSMASERNNTNADPKLTPETGLFWPCHIQKGWSLNNPEVITEDRFLCPDNAEVLSSANAFKAIKDLPRSGSGKRINSRNPLRSLLFWRSFIKSESVFFADNYFVDDNVHEVVIDEIKRGKLVGQGPRSIIIFSNTRKHREIARYMLGQLNINGTGQCSIEVFNFPPEYEIHDRFALFDSKIWHCGTTVGGVHQAFHAISGSWEDAGGGMQRLFSKMMSNIRNK
jgi:hypothetical protein